MKLTISNATAPVLWGFSKLGQTVGVEIRCEECGKWCTIKNVPKKRKKK